MIKAEPFDIVIKKQIDSVTIRDIEEAISSAQDAAVEIIARRQTDSLTITKPPATNIVIKD